MIFVLVGAPGTGKGTRAKIISEKFNIPHISTGEILRNSDELPEDIKLSISKGELLSDDKMGEIVLNRLSKDDCKNGFVLDGYPRTLNQSYKLDEIMNKLETKIDYVVEMHVPEEVIYERILTREICTSCGKAYSKGYLPKVPGICDVCNQEVVKRADDTEETLKRRLEIYSQNTTPIINHYKEKGIFKQVDTTHEPEEIVNQIVGE